jgi:hypothetical protein
LFLLGPEWELLFLSIDVKVDFFGPTSMFAPAVLKNGRPRMSGISFDISMTSTVKSTGMK